MAIKEFAIFDRKYWDPFDACMIAAALPGTTREEMDILEKEISKHRNKKRENALSYMISSFDEMPEEEQQQEKYRYTLEVIP